MHVSQIYARFSPQTDLLFRRAMMLASRHRVVRVHHLIVAAGDEQGGGDQGTMAGQPKTLICAEWVRQARGAVEQDPPGCLDSPMTNSPTVRRVLQLAADRAGGDLILPGHLLAMALCCWVEETPAGTGRLDEERRRIGELSQTLGVRPLPPVDVPVPATASSAGTTREREADLRRVPTVEELEALIGPPVTEDDLIRLYMEMKAACDPAERERLAARLSYLRDHG